MPLQNQKAFSNIMPSEFNIFKPINPFSFAPFETNIESKKNKLKEKKVKKAKKIKLPQTEEAEEKGETHENNDNNEDNISVDGYIDLSKMNKPTSMFLDLWYYDRRPA